MKFLLFSKISFEITDPVVLIESYCFQSDFYSNYDLIEKRTIEHVNSIGARIDSKLLPRCIEIINEGINIPILSCELESFLQLPKQTRDDYIKELHKNIIKNLLRLRGIGFSKTTKILHTLFPKIIPMIDNPLQFKYMDEINPTWTEMQADKILIDYYDNLNLPINLDNLRILSSKLNANGLRNLSMVRIFDILWWSFLKAEDLRIRKNIKWTSVFINQERKENDKS